jgi:nitrogen fixation/metabolism regulation signal transduction histidine kinase
VAALDAGARRVIELDTERGRERALAGKTALTIEGAPCHLVALMPMETELQAETMQAWETLVRVLSHEIMNSLAPVASLAQTSRAMIADARGAGAPVADLGADLDLALEAIGRRADSLARFVDGYRQLACVPEPVAGPVAVAAMLARLDALVGADWRARGGQACSSPSRRH